MTELLTSAEHDHTEGTVLWGNNLREAYKLEFSSLPITIREAEPSEYPTFTAYEHENPHDVYIDRLAHEAQKRSWWEEVYQGLLYASADPEKIESLTLIKKHDVAVKAADAQTNQHYSIFEFGAENPKEDIDVVVNTLKLIDQFSGGLSSVNPDLARVSLINGIALENGHGVGEAGGFAMTGAGVALNTSGLRSLASETGVPYHTLLSVSLVHEMLGHSLEHQLEGRYGKWFEGFFEYSDERKDGHLTKSVHDSITPRHIDSPSHPVREYGQTNSIEDVATSVDSHISEVMGWDKDVVPAERFASSPDQYRKELVMQLMDRAAKVAAVYDHTPGYVGSELRYDFDENDELSVKPLRTFEHTTMPGNEAMADEMKKALASVYIPETVIVERTQLVI